METTLPRKTLQQSRQSARPVQQPDESEIRTALQQAFSERGAEAVARETGRLSTNTVRNFARASHNATEKTLNILREWFRHYHLKSLATLTYPTQLAKPAVVRETAGSGDFAGRAYEIEALLEFALERQRLLRQALGDE